MLDRPVQNSDGLFAGLIMLSDSRWPAGRHAGHLVTAVAGPIELPAGHSGKKPYVSIEIVEAS